MVHVQPVDVDGRVAIGITVELPRTRLVILSTGKGYIMCGALDVGLLNDRLVDRGILAGRALGVRSIDDLLNQPLESVTTHAEALGIRPGMSGREALKRMF